ncbi:pantoate--beta-alanine ligase [Stakelama tenebrarum]|uniref:Pantothenate synthetase n=1 Tax=Stakelama tenebrarum TaxID=2711215 RepID=A0A6G6Y286_9SPHN|nr:pantoate--beta-alanine ligase [Sphingosinithalassobacter tenebrarum]QIG78951.1 pantoate--beta-alanine ligase [Sphingosinithalassobacter tenebrarum]
MQTIRQLDALRESVRGFRAAGERIVLVPTMGALHAGHMALVDTARRHGDRVVVSIFVNPRQFAPGEDFSRYPRQEHRDARMLSEAGVDLLWMPPAEVMYPADFATSIVMSGVSEPLEGAHRPGHFDGVATVVAKLLNQVQPDAAIFGEKDFQQLAVIRRMVADLDMPVTIIGMLTQREDDGLAMSSRNGYLVEEDRKAAVAMPRALGVAERAISEGRDPQAALEQAREILTAAGFEIDYVALVDSETLGEPVAGKPRRLLAAAKIHGTRLIDNVPVNGDG